jgi:hypothetical protein
MNALWSATLNPSSPRYHDWCAVLQADSVPLKSPAECQATLGDESARVYLLDVPRLTEEQSERLAGHLARKFNVATEIVILQLESQGLPIRVEDVIVAFNMRAFV